MAEEVKNEEDNFDPSTLQRPPPGTCAECGFVPCQCAILAGEYRP